MRALAMLYASVLALGSYGTSLFVARPFVMGATSAFAFNQGPRPAGTTLLVAVGSGLLAGGALLQFSASSAA